ncbi:hypothetical protein DPMN_186807 [Dreissena polymorpha]|uniref:Uncharacterized protein n=1 Tax=Dreissena polymorpha TaxID=45954 RepID=A0A9D4DPS5_DREPO|nr:hypothetical protein DPMN_186807 [Dreissena polymorpha]
MATSRNHKSMTLPAGMKHATQPAEDSEGFFAKLKKKLKLKKGKYPEDVNTGECKNVSAVSFKKRQSTAELVGISSWEKGVSHSEKASLRETQSVSPHHLKRGTFKTQSDLHLGSNKSKANHERKHSFPENQLAALKVSAPKGPSDILSSPVSVNSSRVKNEYSKLDYEVRDLASDRQERLKAEVPSHE